MDVQTLLGGKRGASGAGDIPARIADLQEELGELAASLAESGADRGRRAAAASRSQLRAAGGLSRDLGRQAKHAFDDNPGVSIGAAVVFGILVGLFLARR